MTAEDKQNEGFDKFMKLLVMKAKLAKEGEGTQVKILRPTDEIPLLTHLDILKNSSIFEPNKVFTEKIDANAKFMV